MRMLGRDVGGMPLWALTLVVVAVIVIARRRVLGGGAAVRGKTPQYTPPGDAATPTIPAPMPLAVFIGDSYTQGAEGGGVRWPTLVGDALGWDVDNLGLGERATSKPPTTTAAGAPYCGRYGHTIEEIIGSPTYIVVSGGRNDVGLPTADVALPPTHCSASSA